MRDDDYNWESEDISNQDIVLDILKERFAKNKIIGIMLLHLDYGCLFHFSEDKQTVWLLITNNRKKTGSLIFTDYSFYVSILAPILGNITSITYLDTM